MYLSLLPHLNLRCISHYTFSVLSLTKLYHYQLNGNQQPTALRSPYFNAKQSFTGLEIHECIIKTVQEGLTSDNLCSYEIQRNCYLLKIISKGILTTPHHFPIMLFFICRDCLLQAINFPQLHWEKLNEYMTWILFFTNMMNYMVC